LTEAAAGRADFRQGIRLAAGVPCLAEQGKGGLAELDGGLEAIGPVLGGAQAVEGLGPGVPVPGFTLEGERPFVSFQRCSEVVRGQGRVTKPLKGQGPSRDRPGR
jgi:hypothetical protein